MQNHDALRRLCERVRAGRLDRRDFVQSAAALGLGLSSIGALLAACRREGPAAPGAGASAGAAPGRAALEKELSIYNWSDYIAPDTVANFEKEYGVQVRYDTYESNEEMVAKLQAGASGYDLVVPSGYVIPVMVATDLLAPLRRESLSHWSNLSALFQNLPSDPGNTYSIPWQWGTSGIAYRSDKIAAPPDSWSTFLDAAHRDKATMMDDGREVIGAMLRYRGHSLNSVDRAELEAARADAIAAKRQLKAYISAPVKAQLISGDVWIAQLWNGDTTQAQKEQPALGYVIPREGCTIWCDSLVLTKSAPHPNAAHAFADYILRPEVGAAISDSTGYGTPNESAAKLLQVALPYPTPEELQRLEYAQDLGENTALWDQLWTEIKSA